MMFKSLSEIAAGLKIEIKKDHPVSGFEADSRKIQENQVFIALKGEQVDGHCFLEEAATKKAAAAIVSKHYQGKDLGLPLLKVDDVLMALQDLAKLAFSLRPRKVVAVTGSVGKTTTKEFIATLLEGRYKVAKTPGNANSQIGLPLAILNNPVEEEVFVVEMGISQPNEMEKLIEIAPPDIALMTKIGLGHVEFFADGLEGIAKAKSVIFSHPKTLLGVVNIQTFQFDAVLSAGLCEKLSFGTDHSANKADYFLHRKKEGYQIEEKGELSPIFQLPFNASHLCEDFVGATVVARALGMNWEEIISQTCKLSAFKRRFERIEKNGIVYINDCYNANPESVRAALINLPPPAEGGKVVAVLGSMKELGKFSEESHRQIGNLAREYVHELLCYGKESLPLAKEFSISGRSVNHYNDFASLRLAFHQSIQPGDVVLIKASRSLALWRLLDEENALGH